MKKLLIILLIPCVILPTKKHHHETITIVVDKDSPNSQSSPQGQNNIPAAQPLGAVAEEKNYGAVAPAQEAEVQELRTDWTKFKIALLTAGTALITAGATVGTAYLSGKCGK